MEEPITPPPIITTSAFLSNNFYYPLTLNIGADDVDEAGRDCGDLKFKVSKVKESLRSIYLHKVNRISQIENSISKSLNFLILKQDTPEPNRLYKVESPFSLLKAFTARTFPAIQKFFCAV